MNLTSLFFRERSLSKVAATYRDGASAEAAAAGLLGVQGLQDRQIQLVHPYDGDWGRKVEPEGVGIWRTAIRAHVTCGLIGLVAGAMVFAVLYFAGVQAILSTPVMSLFAMMLFALMFGLMLGGALTIRPDHGGVISAVQKAMADGMWSVIAHPATRTQLAAVELLLARTGAPVVRTL